MCFNFRKAFADKQSQDWKKSLHSCKVIFITLRLWHCVRFGRERRVQGDRREAMHTRERSGPLPLLPVPGADFFSTSTLRHCMLRLSVLRGGTPSVLFAYQNVCCRSTHVGCPLWVLGTAGNVCAGLACLPPDSGPARALQEFTSCNTATHCKRPGKERFIQNSVYEDIRHRITYTVNHRNNARISKRKIFTSFVRHTPN